MPLRRKILITFISLFIIAFVVGGVVYFKQPDPPISSQSSTSTLPIPSLGPVPAESADGVASATPSIIPVNTSTEVTVTIQIADSRLISGSVNLQRLDAKGNVLSILGNLNDSGTNGDAVAGDKTYSVRYIFNEATTTPVYLRMSWALKGVLKRVNSNVLNVIVSQMFVNQVGGYKVVVPPGWQVETSTTQVGSTMLTPPGRSPDPQFEYIGDIIIDCFQNPSNSSLTEFYRAPGQVDLFDNSGSHVFFYVNGFQAVRFEEVPGMLPITVVAVSLNGRVIEITDVNNEHQADGIFDAVVYSVIPQ